MSYISDQHSIHYIPIIYSPLSVRVVVGEVVVSGRPVRRFVSRAISIVSHWAAIGNLRSPLSSSVCSVVLSAWAHALVEPTQASMEGGSCAFQCFVSRRLASNRPKSMNRVEALNSFPCFIVINRQLASVCGISLLVQRDRCATTCTRMVVQGGRTTAYVRSLHPVVCNGDRLHPCG